MSIRRSLVGSYPNKIIVGSTSVATVLSNCLIFVVLWMMSKKLFCGVVYSVVVVRMR